MALSKINPTKQPSWKKLVQQFNKDYMNLRIKYLGKLDKMINQLKIKNIELKYINDQWIIKTL